MGRSTKSVSRRNVPLRLHGDEKNGNALSSNLRNIGRSLKCRSARLHRRTKMPELAYLNACDQLLYYLRRLLYLRRLAAESPLYIGDLVQLYSEPSYGYVRESLE